MERINSERKLLILSINNLLSLLNHNTAHVQRCAHHRTWTASTSRLEPSQPEDHGPLVLWDHLIHTSGDKYVTPRHTTPPHHPTLHHLTTPHYTTSPPHTTPPHHLTTPHHTHVRPCTERTLTMKARESGKVIMRRTTEMRKSTPEQTVGSAPVETAWSSAPMRWITFGGAAKTNMATVLKDAVESQHSRPAILKHHIADRQARAKSSPLARSSRGSPSRGSFAAILSSGLILGMYE